MLSETNPRAKENYFMASHVKSERKQKQLYKRAVMRGREKQRHLNQKVKGKKYDKQTLRIGA